MNPRGKVTLEDLLKLKRAERPSPDFWPRFEQELRVRQLAAIVEKRPWWHPVEQVWRAVSRSQLPLGAAVVAVLTVGMVWNYRGVEGWGPMETPAGNAPQPVVLAPSVASTPGEYSGGDVLEPEETEPASSTVRLTAVAPGSVTPMIPWVGEALRSQESGNFSAVPESLVVEASLVEAGLGDMDLGPVLGVNHGFESRALPALRLQTVEEPLARIPSPRDARRQRLLASLTSGPAEGGSRDRSATAQVRERLTRRLSEDELYESVGRLSGGGDRLIVKF